MTHRGDWDWRRVASGAATIVTFVGGATAVLLLANGYTVNWSRWQIEQTAVVSLDGEPRQARVDVDGKTVGDQLPLTMRFVTPGGHTVRIHADGYHDWLSNPRLEPGGAFVRTDVFLWRTTPTEVAPTLTIEALNQHSLVDENLTVRGGEVFHTTRAGVVLVTRFSNPVRSAVLLNDRAHVLVQLGHDLVVTELDGANTTPLVRLGVETATPLVVSDDNTRLTARDGVTVRSWLIR